MPAAERKVDPEAEIEVKIEAIEEAERASVVKVTIKPNGRPKIEREELMNPKYTREQRDPAERDLDDDGQLPTAG